jgi:hypothetical protein
MIGVRRSRYFRGGAFLLIRSRSATAIWRVSVTPRSTSTRTSPLANGSLRSTLWELIQKIIEGVFAPHGGPPRYVEAEQMPLVKRVFLPRSALLSPAHRMFPQQTAEGIVWEIVDDADYDPTPLKGLRQ